jgi:hypothetical protein
MARFFAHPANGPGEQADVLVGERVNWSRHLLWGNYRVRGGIPLPGKSAWALGQRWGGLRTPDGEKVVWGAMDNIVWATRDENIVWATDENIVWATDDNIVWATDDNIVWATDDNIVWATDDNIVWATAANIVWATGVENIVWATDCGGANCVGVVWGQRASSGEIWGTARVSDNIVWATGAENIVWATGGMQLNAINWTASPVAPVLWPSTTRTVTTPGTSRVRVSTTRR